MEMEDGNLADSASDFGELFEGETAVFESSLAEAEALGIHNGLDAPSAPYHIQQLHGHFSHSNQVNIHFTKSSVQLVSEGMGMGDLKFLPDDYLVHNNNHSQSNSDFGLLQESDLKNETEEGDFADGGEVEEAGPEMSQALALAIPPKPKTKVIVVKDVEHFIRVNINKYFKKRGYRGIIFPTTVSKSEVAEMIDPELSRLSTVSNGPNYRPEEIPEELEKFWKFYLKMKTRNESMSNELKPLFFPMLVYFVRQALLSGRPSVYLKLMVEFSKRFLHENKSRESGVILISLAKAKTFKAFEEDKLLLRIYQNDKNFTLSDWTFTQLKQFISKSPRLVLLNVFTNHFVIELRSSQEMTNALCDESDESDSDSDHEKDTRSNRVQEVLDNLRGSVKPNLPSIVVYTTNGRPLCGAISKEGTTLAYGMGTAGIRICATSSAKDPNSQSEERDTEYTPAIQTVNGHEGSVYGVGFHPKAKLLFSVGEDSCMRTWDLNKDNNVLCKAVYRGHLGPIWSLDISPSGQLIATGSMDSSARIWVPERSDCVRILAGHYFDVDCVKFHPNEAYVATGSIDKSVRLWSVSDGNMVRIMTGSEGRVSAIAFHQSGKYLAGAGEDDRIRIWDIAEGKLLAEFPSQNACKDLSFYDNMLAGCFQSGDVLVWNVRKIVGGDFSDSPSSQVKNLGPIPAPCLIKCDASSLFKLYYKDPCNLYCLGSDPVLDSDPPDQYYLSPSTPNENSPVHVTVNDFDGTDAPSSSGIDDASLSSTSNNTTPEEDEEEMDFNELEEPEDEEDIENEVEDENTNQTITSSDIEFEVDDQLLLSLVEEEPPLSPT